MNTFNDAPDSYWAYVMARVQAVNPARRFIAAVDANDWPPKQLEFEAFYMILLAATPLTRGASQASPFMTMSIQWTWAILGTDIQGGIRGRSRGDRGRKNRQMMSELIEGNYPGFTEKKSYELDNDTGLMVATSFDPIQHISWTMPSFGQNNSGGKSTSDSGLIYGYATVYLSDTPVTVTNQ